MKESIITGKTKTFWNNKPKIIFISSKLKDCSIDKNSCSSLEGLAAYIGLLTITLNPPEDIPSPSVPPF